MASPALLRRAQQKFRGQISNTSWAFLLLGLALGLLGAVFVVSGQWQLAFGLALVLPAMFLLFRYPILAVIVWLLLGPFLFTTSTTSGRMVYWLVHRALPPIGVGILILSYLMRIRKLPKLGLVELAMIGYVAVSLFSIAFLNPTPQETTVQFYDQVISPMCLYLVIRLSAPGEQEIKQLLPVICFLGLTQATIGALSWLAPHLLPQAWLHLEGERATGTLISVSVYVSTLIFAGLFMFHAALNHKPGWIRLLYLGAFSLSVFGVFIGFSRAGWLAQIVVIMGLAYLYPKYILPWIFVMIPAIVLIVGVLFAGDFYNTSQRLNESQTALSRLPVAAAAFHMFELKPLFGWGYGNFDLYDRQFQARVGDLVDPRSKDMTSHNLYLTILAEQGLVGVILYMAPVIVWLYETLKRRRKIPERGFNNRKLLFVLWLVVLVHIIVNNFSDMWVGFGYGIWWLTLGLIANLVSRSTSETLAMSYIPRPIPNSARATDPKQLARPLEQRR